MEAPTTRTFRQTPHCCFFIRHHGPPLVAVLDMSHQAALRHLETHRTRPWVDFLKAVVCPGLLNPFFTMHSTV
jgi:hypothetical protein